MLSKEQYVTGYHEQAETSAEAPIRVQPPPDLEFSLNNKAMLCWLLCYVIMTILFSNNALGIGTHDSISMLYSKCSGNHMKGTCQGNVRYILNLANDKTSFYGWG